ncbi:hypothetical protein CC80DRAFT_533809 [Byssothecium circinans]|uniref:Uncharacterized protein n=1 Tax=Byssothecium circinans TaxID=147558 RepID=A0A6A5U3C9_9PLEO|nr:hypothetical protein CC80DRAFT_533809 [Byssothecium circinans]
MFFKSKAPTYDEIHYNPQALRSTRRRSVHFDDLEPSPRTTIGIYPPASSSHRSRSRSRPREPSATNVLLANELRKLQAKVGRSDDDVIDFFWRWIKRGLSCATLFCVLAIVWVLGVLVFALCTYRSPLNWDNIDACFDQKVQARLAKLKS